MPLSLPILSPLVGVMAVSPVSAPETQAFDRASWRHAMPNLYTRETLRSKEEEYVVLKTLGRRGLDRIFEFQEYPRGWGDGTHEAYSPLAYRTMLKFLRRFAFPSNVTPSVFFTREGGFELAWEANTGSDVQVEFAPKRIEVYHQELGLEEELKVEELEKLFSLLEGKLQ